MPNLQTGSWVRRKGIQLAYPFEEKRLAKWEPPYIVQPKFDGDRCRAVPTQDGHILLSSEENPFFSVPHILEELEKLRYTDYEYDGELYCHGMRHEQIHSIVSRTVNMHPNAKAIHFHIFDIVDEQKIQAHRLGDLIQLNEVVRHGFKYIEIAPFYIADTLEDVLRYYNNFLEAGYEGMIVRHHGATYVRRRSTYMMKFKPKKEDIYVIIGVVEEVSIAGNPKNALGALICSGDDGTPFNVGTGFTRADRESLWERAESLIGMQVRVQYQHLTAGKKKPRHSVFVEVIENEMEHTKQ
jgi:DNA ligase-1